MYSIEITSNLFNEHYNIKVFVMASYPRELNSALSWADKKYSLSGLPLNKKYRSHFEIIALMLEAVKAEGATRFPIMRYAGINYTQLKRYLNSLVELGFIEIDMRSNGALYRASRRGLEFLRQYYVLLSMLLSMGVQSAPALLLHKRSSERILQSDV
jgi:predicted transcriptional regulator